MEHTMNMNTKITHQQKAMALVQEKGIVRSSEFVEAGIPRVVVSRMVANNNLQQLERGLYCLPEKEFSEKEKMPRRQVPKITREQTVRIL